MAKAVSSTLRCSELALRDHRTVTFEEILGGSARNDLGYPACHSLGVVCDLDVLDQGLDVRATTEPLRI